MHGSHHLLIQSAHLKYEFDLVRNITVIQGDSATGKTTLADMIREVNVNGSDTGISISCDVPCRLLEGNHWAEQLSLIRNSIVFIDEGNRFAVSRDFAEAIRHTSNYYCIITRESLQNLPYSVTEIYGIHSSGKYNSLEPVYHSLYRIYRVSPISMDPSFVIVEDSNSGYEFWSKVFSPTVKCISANGRDRIFELLHSGEITGNVLVIADGAAFGSQMHKVYDTVRRNANIELYLPESFEWILLDSDIFHDPDIRRILKSPENEIESEEYFSWERYFTQLIIDKSRGTYLQYSKSKLNPSYLNSAVLKKILGVVPVNISKDTP